ncbi:hypothetical protein M9H77_19971 [Catharanthus roseus]|uniref:Uncharacterized protein n=1 Tax=Catharanthus roseus TaxID=4058 RepID=A0ACC0AKZ5_CATRO|nr:hypothetical protein M9H77_19971 [Catharanthus roseus]
MYSFTIYKIQCLPITLLIYIYISSSFRRKTHTYIYIWRYLKESFLCEEPEFTYGEKSPSGPAHWGEITPEWRICSTGKSQSPINILDGRVIISPELGRLRKEHKASVNATLINNGHAMMLQWVNGGGNLFINQTSYQLKQCHWHSPSEHTINGRRFDLEIHLVHQTPDGKTAVIGLMYEIGLPDPFLSKLEKDIEALAHTKGIKKDVGIIDPNLINLGKNPQYYRYIGSLTTPPCNENVIWTIIKKVNTVSIKQVQLLKEAIQDEAKKNARPIQPTNNRLIKLFKPKA